MKILLAKARPRHVEQLLAPLGLLYLAGYLARFRPRDEVRLIDLRITKLKHYAELVREWEPDVVAISAMTAEAGSAGELATMAKRIHPHTRVVMGGPHPTGYTQEVLSNLAVDFVVRHEGEETFARLLDQIEGDKRFAEVDGIAYRDDSAIVQITRPRAYIEDLDALPSPQWDLVDFSRYAKVQSFSLRCQRVAPIFTSRACPYQCAYCHDMFGKKLQKRSVNHVLDELQMLVEKYQVRHFDIVDDIFNLDKKRAAAILQGIIDRKLNVKLAFPNGLRGDILTEDLIDLFARAGTEIVSLAVETASPRLQKHIKKNLDLDAIQRSIKAFVDRKVATNCFYMLGFPTETVEEMKLTIDFALRQPNHGAAFFLVTPYQGTPLHAEIERGRIHSHFEDYNYHGATFNVTADIPDHVLAMAPKLAYLRFYANPLRLYRLVRDFPSKSGLLRLGYGLIVRKFLRDSLNDVVLRQLWRPSRVAQT